MKSFKNQLNQAIRSKDSTDVINNMRDIYHAYFDSPFDIPQETKQILEKSATFDDSDDDDSIIKGYDLLAQLEDRIAELESISNDYAKSNKVDTKTKKKVLRQVNTLRKDFNKYEKKIEGSLTDLGKDKTKLQVLKQHVKENDKDIKEIEGMEKKIDSIYKRMTELDKSFEARNKRLDNIIKMFR